MKKNVVLIFISLFLVQSVFAEDKWELSEQFITKLKSGGLIFVEPSIDVKTDKMIEQRCKTVPILENSILEYDMAMQSLLAPLEIRYIIHLNDSGKTIDTEDYLDVISKLSDSVSKPLVLDPKNTKDFFGAEWGATWQIVPKKEFMSPFKKGIVFGFRNDKQGWLYILFLFDELTPEVQAEMSDFEILNTLKFY